MDDAVEMERDVRIQRHDQVSDLQAKWDKRNGYHRNFLDDDDKDELTMAQTKKSEEDTEFDVVKYEYKDGHYINIYASQLWAEMNSLRSEVKMFHDGVDLLAKEEEAKKRNEEIIKRAQIAVKEEERKRAEAPAPLRFWPSTTPRDDAKDAERWRVREEEKAEERRS